MDWTERSDGWRTPTRMPERTTEIMAALTPWPPQTDAHSDAVQYSSGEKNDCRAVWRTRLCGTAPCFSTRSLTWAPRASRCSGSQGPPESASKIATASAGASPGRRRSFAATALLWLSESFVKASAAKCLLHFRKPWLASRSATNAVTCARIPPSLAQKWAASDAASVLWVALARNAQVMLQVMWAASDAASVLCGSPRSRATRK